MGIIGAYILALIMLLGGSRGGTDLLDAVLADTYWQIKNITPTRDQLEKDAGVDAAPVGFDDLIKTLASDDFATRDKARQELERMGPAIIPQLKPVAASVDPEVAAVATDLIKRFSEHSQERAIRRLMAIRTLGEHKEKASLPLLNGLTDSKEMFVADYARRAIAQINNEKQPPIDHSAAMAGDLALLPKETALVAQASGINPEQLTVATVVEKSIAFMALQPGKPGAPPANKPDAKQMVIDASKGLLSILERVGNIRLDGISLGFNYQKPDDGWFTVIVRGKYDSARVFATAKELLGVNAKNTPALKPGDVPMISDPSDDMNVLFPNDEQLILLSTPNEKSAPIRDLILTALKAGKGNLADNKEIAALLKAIDTKSPIWAAANLTDAMATDIFTHFKTITLESKPTKDGIAITINGDGTDEKEVKASVDQLGASLKQSLEMIHTLAQTNQSMQPVADFMSSIKLVSEAKHATFTAEVKSEIIYSILGETGTMLPLIPHP